MKPLSETQRYLLDALDTGVETIVTTSSYATIVNNPTRLRVVRGGTPAALRGLAKRGLITCCQQWRCAIVTKLGDSSTTIQGD